MSFSKANRSDTTGTRNRTRNSVSPSSGLCVTCQEGCRECVKSAIGGKRERCMISGSLLKSQLSAGERISSGFISFQFIYGLNLAGVDQLDRDDLVALTREASEISGIKYVMEVDRELADRILES